MDARAILVVDDEDDILQLLVFVLSREGHTVYSASTVESALLLLTKCPIDVVLTDYMMPLLNGEDLIRSMCATQGLAHIPVLVLSALPEEIVRLRCRGIAGFLRKPFQLEDLRNSLESLLKDIA